MSYPLVIRLMIAMALMPDASYCEALSRLAGLLADIPFTRDRHIPTEKVITGWRLPVPPSLMEALFWQAAGPLAGDDGPSAVMLAGMPVAGADGMLVSVADTAVNRDFFGTTGTGDGSSSFPQLRVVALIARAGRAMLGAILGQASAGEQTLLKRLVKRRPDLFRGLVICFDRNFPGHDLITAILSNSAAHADDVAPHPSAGHPALDPAPFRSVPVPLRSVPAASPSPQPERRQPDEDDHFVARCSMTSEAAKVTEAATAITTASGTFTTASPPPGLGPRPDRRQGRPRTPGRTVVAHGRTAFGALPELRESSIFTRLTAIRS